MKRSGSLQPDEPCSVLRPLAARDLTRHPYPSTGVDRKAHAGPAGPKFNGKFNGKFNALGAARILR